MQLPSNFMKKEFKTNLTDIICHLLTKIIFPLKSQDFSQSKLSLGLGLHPS